MKRALVLSGGGARGAYQVGVWRALRELEIDIHIVTGTSVGCVLLTENTERRLAVRRIAAEKRNWRRLCWVHLPARALSRNKWQQLHFLLNGWSIFP